MSDNRSYQPRATVALAGPRPEGVVLLHRPLYAKMYLRKRVTSKIKTPGTRFTGLIFHQVDTPLPTFTFSRLSRVS